MVDVAASNEPEHSSRARREEYLPEALHENFIVSLLSDEIDRFLDQYVSKDQKVLHVGCGSQPLRSSIEAKGARYFSLDVVEIDGTTIDFICPIDEALPAALDDQTFDVIVCTEVLEHCANWPVAFENLARLQGHHGVMLVTCPHLYPLHEEPYDFYRPTIHAISHYAKQNDLDVLSLRKAGNVWDVMGTVLPLIRFVPRYGRFYDRWFARLVDFGRRCLLRSINSGLAMKLVDGRSDLYLSNIAILRKRG